MLRTQLLLRDRRLRRLGILAGFAFALVLSARPSDAGQVRVSVSSNVFTPRAINANLGDHVVWVWTGGGHTVTSGDSASQTPDGKFDSGLISAALLGAFSWKANVSGHTPYYCEPHAPSMAGRVIIGSPVAVADFRITEVQYNLASGQDVFEIANLGGASGDLGRYRIVASHDTAVVPAASYIVPPGSRVIVHVNASGTQAAPAHLYLPTLLDLPDNGSLALYVPNTKPGTSLSDATQIIDYVEWGTTAGQANEATAVAAGLWQAGQVLAPLGAGNSLEFCGGPGVYGPASWGQISPPSPGTDSDCLTSAKPSTWGRIKSLYR